jgi:hypothetical protein
MAVLGDGVVDWVRSLVVLWFVYSSLSVVLASEPAARNEIEDGLDISKGAKE